LEEGELAHGLQLSPKGAVLKGSKELVGSGTSLPLCTSLRADSGEPANKLALEFDGGKRNE
jgi:hypothetical protein